MRRSSLVRIGVGSASVALALTTVVGNATMSSATGSRGGTLYILSSLDNINHLDPQRNYTGEDIAFATGFLTRSLTQYAYDSNPTKAAKIVADGASNTGSTADSGKTWAFKIRNGQKWQDGTAVTCADYKYGISRSFARGIITGGSGYSVAFLDIPKSGGRSIYKGPYATVADDGTATSQKYASSAAKTTAEAAFNTALSCSKSGSTETLTFKLVYAVPDFNGATTLSEFSAVKQSQDTGATYDRNIFSDGPYKIDSYEVGTSLILVRNPNWNAAADATRLAYPDRIEVDWNIEPQVISARLIADNGPDKTAISADGVYSDDLPTVFGSSTLTARVDQGYDPYVTYTALDTTKLNLAHRKALALAWPRETLRQLAGGDYAGYPADGVIKPSLGADYAPTNAWGYNTSKTVHTAAKAAKKVGNAYVCGGPLPANPVKGTMCEAYDTVTTTPHPGLLGYVVPVDGSCTQAVDALKGAAAGTVSYAYYDSGSPKTAQAVAAIKAAVECAGFILDLNRYTDIGDFYTDAFSESQSNMMNTGWAPDWLNASTVIPPLFQTDNSWNLSHYDESTFQAKIATALQTVKRSDQAKLWQALNKEAVSNVLVIPRTFTNVQRQHGSGVKGTYIWGPYGSYNYGQISVN